jgi:hypothetical protein
MSDHIIIQTVTALDLVQQGHALALQTSNTQLSDACASLHSALMASDTKQPTAKIRRVPHEAQIAMIRQAITAQRERDGSPVS